jgi:serine phosphatase RsbU (regulator of sigma subunit)
MSGFQTPNYRSPHLKLSTLIGDVNRFVYGSSPTHIFATLFYAEYEPAKRLLH